MKTMLDAATIIPALGFFFMPSLGATFSTDSFSGSTQVVVSTHSGFVPHGSLAMAWLGL